MELADLIAKCVGFEWDEGNLAKSWEKHEVSGAECEQIFFNKRIQFLKMFFLAHFPYRLFTIISVKILTG